MGRAPKQAWTSTSRVEENPWGESRIWDATSGTHGKIISIMEGHRTSLKYHKIKNEVFMVLSGVVRVDFGSSETLRKPEKYPMQSRILREGDVLHVLSECPYRLTALEDCRIIEVGDKHDNEPVRIEDDYGRKSAEQS
jgi:mannose-6-phosphate isomerase-like protein (cupin superfamily)